MTKLHILIFLVTLILGFITDSISEAKLNISCLFLLGICICWLIQLKIMLIITLIVLYGLGYALRQSKDIKSLKTTLCTSLIILAVLIMLNRGVVTRIYDRAGVLSIRDEIMLNQQIRYDGKIDGVSGTKVKLYIATNTTDGIKDEKLYKIVEKVHKRDNTFVIVLCYDVDGNFLRTGYSYSLDWFYEVSGIDTMRDKISKIMIEEGLSGNIDKISDCVAATLGEIEYFDDDEYYDDLAPGVHWVDGYYRSDGTYVDGYWRTDPDGDPTNNFSYNGFK